MKPGPGDTDFEQWQSAMKMVARLPDGVPHEFRNTVRIHMFFNKKLLLSIPVTPNLLSSAGHLSITLSSFGPPINISLPYIVRN